MYFLIKINQQSDKTSEATKPAKRQNQRSVITSEAS